MENKKPSCFVVQGFGTKRDYIEGRELDLNASYKVIKRAVEAAGVECVRADEIIHSGIIDVPMYERLLNADLVIADLSTYNVNAAFELGVRYALKPYTTIVIADDKFKSPFDVNHVVIRQYKHLGEDIGSSEAERFTEVLKTAIQAILNAKDKDNDSPVYIYLPQLRPPQVNHVVTNSSQQPTISVAPTSAEVTITTGENNPSAKVLLDVAIDKINAGDFLTARPLLEEVRKLHPNDSFVLQKLALATYKSEQPSVLEALKSAHEILQELAPKTSNNPETLGLWGAVHKRLWEETGKPEYLDESIKAYERGFYIKQDHYNGINLSYLLNVRAVEKLKNGNKDEATADAIIAKRVYQDVIRYTMPLIDGMEAEEETMPPDEKKKKDMEKKRYWLIATLWEAAIGAGDEEAASKWEREAKAMHVAHWMQDTRESQGAKLRASLAIYAELVKGK